MEEANLERDFGVTENRGQAAIAQQGGREIQEGERIRSNRMFLECLKTSERVLTRYLPSYQKPSRFLKVFADELFEKRIKESTEAYHEFLDYKIRELQMRNGRLSGYQTLRLPYGKHKSLNESYWGRGIWKQ